jgi:hypothetical protein
LIAQPLIVFARNFLFRQLQVREVTNFDIIGLKSTYFFIIGNYMQLIITANFPQTPQFRIFYSQDKDYHLFRLKMVDKIVAFKSLHFSSGFEQLRLKRYNLSFQKISFCFEDGSQVRPIVLQSRFHGIQARTPQSGMKLFVQGYTLKHLQAIVTQIINILSSKTKVKKVD